MNEFIDENAGPLAGAAILQGKIAMVTGAGSGIGEACTQLFVKQGAKVLAVDLDIGKLEKVCSKLPGSKERAIAVQADVTEADDLDRAFERAMHAFGGLDVLVNNAGGGQPTDFFSIDEAEWNQVLKLNLTSVFLASQRAARFFMMREGGSIVNMSSLAGRSASVTAGVHYTAGKAGILGLTRHLARNLAPYNIRVNAVCPGVTNSERIIRRLNEGGMAEQVAQGIPLGRIGDVYEVASVCLFLASDLSSYITGATIDVNGGALMI
jgi:NAD(P)-dependent dehydrogenase (short-subunit alcohol dehydrogenase family)